MVLFQCDQKPPFMESEEPKALNPEMVQYAVNHMTYEAKTAAACAAIQFFNLSGYSPAAICRLFESIKSVKGNKEAQNDTGRVA